MQKLVSDTITIYRNKFFDVNVEGYAVYSQDPDYGADADGNRATMRTNVEEIKDIQAFEIDGNEIELTQEEIERANMVLTDKFLEG